MPEVKLLNFQKTRQSRNIWRAGAYMAQYRNIPVWNSITTNAAGKVLLFGEEGWTQDLQKKMWSESELFLPDHRKEHGKKGQKKSSPVHLHISHGWSYFGEVQLKTDKQTQYAWFLMVLCPEIWLNEAPHHLSSHTHETKQPFKLMDWRGGVGKWNQRGNNQATQFWAARIIKELQK